MSNFSIAGRVIGPEFPPYIIAEMSANHNGDLSKAFQIIELAKKNGADALKNSNLYSRYYYIKVRSSGFPY